jgi:2-polyprenyl-3-methyl-5-hydroxy-6-metoxy-1,4-benzoquinol methylase
VNSGCALDRFIAEFSARPDEDLMLTDRGVAYQRDRTHRIRYDDDYLRKFDAYDPKIAARVNAGRCALLERHLPKGASILDIGAGNGSFVRAARRAGFEAYGVDPIPKASHALQEAGLYATDPDEFDAVTMWDVIEHMDNPGAILHQAKAFLFASVPVFDDFSQIRASKHYRPGEHLYYWSPQGFIDWAALYGFSLVDQSTHETDAGRDSIGAFAFRKV